MRPISLPTGMPSAVAAAFSASQNAASSEIDVRWPAMVNERLTGRLIAAPSCVTAAAMLARPPWRDPRAAMGPARSLVALGRAILPPEAIEAARLQSSLGGTLVALVLGNAEPR